MTDTPPSLSEVVTKAVKFTASRQLTEEESGVLLGNVEAAELAGIDARLGTIGKMGVFDGRCLEYLQDCFSANQMIITQESGPGKPCQWLLLSFSGKLGFVKLDKTTDTLSIHRLKGEDDEPARLIVERVLHWMWLRLTSNC